MIRTGMFVTLFCLLFFPAQPLLAQTPAPESDLSFYERFMKRLQTGFKGPIDSHYYFKDGFRAESSGGNLKIKIGGEIRLDGGYIAANETLKRTFTDFPGWKTSFRELKVRLSGSLYENWKFQFDMDFANVRQIKDIWISYGKIPFLGNIKVGHTKVPFSLEGFMSNADSVGDPRFWGFYVYGSYCLTGEHRAYDRTKGIFKGVTPAKPFHFKDGWGALEATVRLSYVDLNSRSIQGGKEVDLTAGFNWYLNNQIRLMFNYVHARVMDREDPPIDGGNADIFQVRFQFKL
jgi:phosphate-selective porin